MKASVPIFAALMCAALSAAADTVWLDESGVWDRMSAGHGKCQAHTNGVDILLTTIVEVYDVFIV